MKAFFVLLSFLLFIYSCTSVDYDNPLDRQASNFLGEEYVRDDNGDGVPNFRDPTSEFYTGERDSVPTDTVEHRLEILFYASNDSFNISESVPFFVRIESSAGVDRVVYDFTGDGEEDTQFIVVSDSLVRFVYSETGLYRATATVFDNEGKSASDTFNITIMDRASEIDTIPPVITLIGADTVSVAIGGNYVEPGFVVSDNRDSIPASFVVVNVSQLNLSIAGVYAITYSVSDLSNNVATATRYVRVYARPQVITPVITLLGSTDTNLMQNALWVEPGFTITDASDPEIEVRATITFVNIQGDTVTNNFTRTPGIYVIYYNAVNASGIRAETRARNVTVRATSSLPGAASSLPSSPPSSLPPTSPPPASSVSPPISSQAVSSVPSVVDITPPVVTLVGSASMQHIVGNAFVDPGATAADNVDGDVSGFVESRIYRASDTQRTTVIGRNFFLNTEGSYIIVYSVSDAAGNVGEAVRSVSVVISASSVASVSSAAASSVSANLPVILLREANRNPDTVFVGTVPQYNDPGAMAFDGSLDITSQIVVQSNVNVNVEGTYSVIYSVTNSAGLTATVTRVVVISRHIDRVPPVISLIGPVLVRLHINSPFVEPGFTASDDIDGNIANRVVTTVRNSSGIEVDISTFTQTAGIYTVAYNVSDAAGNNAQERIRDIIVAAGIEITQWGVDVLIEESGAIEIQVAAPSYYTGSTAIFRCQRVNTGLNMPVAGSLVINSTTFSLNDWSPAPGNVPLNGVGTITINQPVTCRIGH